MTTIERVITLQRVALFADTPGRILAAVARRATEVEVTAGEVLIEEGSLEDHLFALVRGRLRVHRGEVTVATLEPGASVGELAALVPEPRSASVTAVEPSTLLRIEKAVLDELLLDWPELATGVIAALVATIRERTPSGSDEPGTDEPGA
ncbi:MAG TPA: cyclic nucleotide-binding domain-containing protein [Candidatus Limnocylindrales bacterium]|nr:cyclic nucleotide-binding domain-containing protein [Candidatus Limnocylindrales bacterium]